MCLIDNRIFRFTLRKIPVYKVVEWHSKDNCYRSPFMHTKVERISIPKNRKNPTILFERGLYYKFEGGFIHAYRSLARAQIASSMLKVFHYTSTRLFKGYIPPFTRYAVDCEDGSICARKMIFPDI